MCKLVKPSVEKPWLKYFPEEAREASVPQNTIYRHLRENNEETDAATRRSTTSAERSATELC